MQYTKTIRNDRPNERPRLMDEDGKDIPNDVRNADYIDYLIAFEADPSCLTVVDETPA